MTEFMKIYPEVPVFIAVCDTCHTRRSSRLLLAVKDKPFTYRCHLCVELPEMTYLRFEQSWRRGAVDGGRE